MQIRGFNESIIVQYVRQVVKAIHYLHSISVYFKHISLNTINVSQVDTIKLNYFFLIDIDM
jgi:serine/threonine protein kinase